MKRIMISAFALVLTTSSAWATEGQLIPGLTPPWVYVWKSSSALDEGQALLAARADRALIAPLVACLVETGTRAVYVYVSYAGMSRQVVVLDGPRKGCRGFIDGRDWKWTN